MSLWELCTQLFARNWRCGGFAQSLSQGCSEKIRKKDVVMNSGRWWSWSIQILLFLMLRRLAMKTALIHRPRDRVPCGSMLAPPDPRRPDRANPATNFWWFLFLTALHNLHALGSHWTDSQQGILCWGVKGVHQEIPSEEASALQITSVHFHQDNVPVHISILVSDYLTKMGIQTVPQPPYNPDLAPCDCWLFPKLKEKLRVCRYESIEELKKAVTKVIDTLTQEDFHGVSRSFLEWYDKCIAAGEITSKRTRVSCVYAQ